MAADVSKSSPEMFAGYIPVLHDGYVRAFDRNPNASIGIFNKEIISEYADYLRKDIRALNPEDAKKAITGLGRSAAILDLVALDNALKRPIVMPDDDITRNIKEVYPNAEIMTEPVFLRWDRNNSTEKQAITPDRVVKMDDEDPIIMTLGEEMAKSTNWWRHVSSAIVNDEGGVIIKSHNSSLPTEHTSMIECDPRITARKCESIDRSIDMHSELANIAEAARHGIALEGMSIFVTTFPCPFCAKAIAHSGIKSCYFIEGYATLDGQSTLRDSGVEIVRVETDLPPEDSHLLKPYPKK